jgi:hypothetical protein
MKAVTLAFDQGRLVVVVQARHLDLTEQTVVRVGRDRAEQFFAFQVDAGRHEQLLGGAQLGDVQLGVGAADVDADDLAGREGGRHGAVLAGGGSREKVLQDLVILGAAHRLHCVLRVARGRIDQHTQAILVVDQIGPFIIIGEHPARIAGGRDQRRVRMTRQVLDGLYGADLFDGLGALAGVGALRDGGRQLAAHLLKQQNDVGGVCLYKMNGDRIGHRWRS